MNINFEFKARDTPQHNSYVEVGLLKNANRGRAMMIAANVPYAQRHKLFWEAFTTASHLDGLVIVKINRKEATRYEHWNGSNPKWSKLLRTRDEAGVVKFKRKFTPKVVNRGEICMCVVIIIIQ